MKKWADMSPRERDALVHKYVMANSRKKIEGTNFEAGPQYRVNIVDHVDSETKTVTMRTELSYPPYSTDISAAFSVVTEMRHRGYEFMTWSHGTDGIRAKFTKDDKEYDSGICETYSVAACLAAIRACGVEV